MRVPRIDRKSVVAGLVVGLSLGWTLFREGSPRLMATGGDRWADSILATGQLSLRYHDGLKVQVAQDAIYLLDYKTGRLMASVPSNQTTGTNSSILGPFAERDLVADFKIQPGTAPHFLMTTGSLGGYDEGNSPLFVVETTTSQVAVYRVQFQIVGANHRPRFELVEMRSYARPPAVGVR